VSRIRAGIGGRSIGAALLAAGLVLAPAPSGAVTKLEGEYNLMLDIRKQDRAFEWDYESNNNDTYSNAEFRLFTQPRPGVEAFLKAGADWQENDNGGERPGFQFREGHLRYRWELPKDRGFDSYLFSRQSRFWVDNHLIPVVRDENANDGGNAQGIRVDSWGYFHGLNATFIASDFSAQFDPTNSERNDPKKTDDAYVVRLRHEFFDRRLRTGFTYNRKVENEPNETPGSFAEVGAFDMRYTFQNIDFSLEFSQSTTKGPGPTVRNADALDQKFLGIPLSDKSVWVGEIRSIHFGTPRLGYLNMAPVGWLRGPLYDNRLGDSNRDERGYIINTWYLVPARAITLTNNWLEYEKKASLRRKTTEFYSEAYVEFVNGFTGKAFYRRRRTMDDLGGGVERVDKNDDIFAELQVESRLAWLRIEGKIKNLDTNFEKELGAIETSVNLGEKTKIYNRLVFGNDPTGLRRILFTQLQYRPSGNMELFVEYGPGWIGDGQRPVDDGDLEGNGVQKDLVKVFLKGTF